MRLPLAMLYEQKRALKIRIRKNESSNPGLSSGPAKKLLLGKPLGGGGLAKPSSLASKPKVEEAPVQQPSLKIEEEEVK